MGKERWRNRKRVVNLGEGGEGGGRREEGEGRRREGRKVGGRQEEGSRKRRRIYRGELVQVPQPFLVRVSDEPLDIVVHLDVGLELGAEGS